MAEGSRKARTEVFQKRQVQDLPVEYFVNLRTRAEAIGERVRTRREQLGLKQEHVRAKLELQGVYISRANFSRIETGDRVPDALELEGLVHVLDASFAWLIRGE